MRTQKDRGSVTSRFKETEKQRVRHKRLGDPKGRT